MRPIRIQMKVYDTEGRRVETVEAEMPSYITADDAAMWVRVEAARLSSITGKSHLLKPYPYEETGDFRGGESY